MNRAVAAVVFAFVLLCGRSAQAHRIDEYLQATIVSLEPNRVDGAMRLIPGVLVAPAVIASIDSDHDGVFSESEMRAYAGRVLADMSITVDGQPTNARLDAWTIPDPAQLRDGQGEIHIEYHVDLPPAEGRLQRRLVLANRHSSDNSVYLVNAEVPRDAEISILGQTRNERQSVYELDFQQLQTGVASVPPGQQLRAFLHGTQMSDLFRLGMRHIAEGTDHLLFLLVLLLPAPLLAVHRRWQRTGSVRDSLLHILGIVTAFTLGHSLTLSLAAMNVVHVPGRPVEVLIAVSILVSAMHALRPLFPGREAWIAAFFGLIHGLAFAATLDRLGLSRWDRLAGILAFNLGIEAMQLLVVAAVLPSLLLLSRTTLYPAFRICGAVSAAAAAVAWIAERVLNLQTPVDTVATAVTRQAVPLAAALFLVSLGCSVFARRQARTQTA